MPASRTPAPVPAFRSVLREDERALLGLILMHRRSYAAIASMLDVDVEEVRSRARVALTTMAGEDPDREVCLTDYLLGQDDLTDRAGTVLRLFDDAHSHALASRLSMQLRQIAPTGGLPTLPPAPAIDPGPPGVARSAAGDGGRRAPRRQRDGRGVTGASPRALLGSTLPNGKVLGLSLVPGGLGLLLLALALVGGVAGALGEQFLISAGVVLCAMAFAAASLVVMRVRPALPEARHRRLVHAGTAILLAAVSSQLVVPPILIGLVRNRLEQLGTVKHLSMSMPFPALAGLVFGSGPENVDLHLGSVDATKLSKLSGDAGAGISSLSNISDAHVQVDRLAIGPLAATNVDVQKRGNALQIAGSIDPASVGPALGIPPGGKITVTEAAPTQVALSIGLGGQGQLGVRLYAQNGALMAQMSPDQQIAAQMGIQSGTAMPARPLIRPGKITFNSFGARTQAGQLRLAASARLSPNSAAAVAAVAQPISPPFQPSSPPTQSPPGATTPTPTTPQPSPPAAQAPGGGAAPGGATILRLQRCLAQQGVNVSSGQQLTGSERAKAIGALQGACRRYLPPGSIPAG